MPVTEAAGTERGLHLSDLVGHSKKAVKLHDVALFGILRLLHRGRVRHDLHDLGAQFLFGLFEDVDRIFIAFAHLPSVEPGHCRGFFTDAGFRNHEQTITVTVVKLLRDVPGHFEVLLLILAHRNDVRIEDDDVRSLQDRVGEESVRGRDPLAHLVLIRDTALQ